MTRKPFVRFLVLIIALASLRAAAATLSQTPQTDGYRRQTSVTLIPHGPDGQLVTFTKADIYLDLWNGGQLVSLPWTGQSATLRLDQEWLCGAWTELCKIHMEPARIILRADGYAPVTAIVYWPGQERHGNKPRASSAGIEFPGGREIRIDEGSSQNIDIAFRRSTSRIVQIIDESGIPAAGIPMYAFLYFAATSHVAGIEGELLIDRKTDAKGQVSFSDVDGEVAIELERGKYVFQQPDRVSDFRKIITLAGDAATTTLVIHRFQKQPLDINFVNRSGSASGLILGTCLKFYSGACCGDEAMTDAIGHVLVEDFYPEEIDSLYLTDKFGTVLWKGDAPRVGNTTGTQTITLPATSR
jgi:hypothetical protein